MATYLSILDRIDRFILKTSCSIFLSLGLALFLYFRIDCECGNASLSFEMCRHLCAGDSTSEPMAFPGIIFRSLVCLLPADILSKCEPDLQVRLCQSDIVRGSRNTPFLLEGVCQLHPTSRRREGLLPNLR